MARIVQVARFQADGTQVTRTFEQMGRAGEQMSQRIQRGSASMTPALRGIDSAAGVAQQKIQGLAGSAGSLGTVLTAMGPAGLAAAAAIGALTLGFAGLQRATRGAVRDLAAIADASSELGVSTNFVQEFRFAVLGTGSDISVADSALRSFSRNLGQLNTDLGQRARDALSQTLGFSDEEIRNMRSVEEALPRIIDRIGTLRTASDQQAAAQKLGLEGVLQVLQGGEAAFFRAQQSARRMGYVIESDLIQRIGQLNGEWTQASEAMDVQIKAALVELAPLFRDLAVEIAGAARALRNFIDVGRETDRVSERTARIRAGVYYSGAQRLRERWGDDVTFGGDPDRARSPRDILNLTSGGPRDLQQARDLYARYMQEWNDAVTRISELDTLQQNLRQPTSPTSDPAAAAALAQMRQFVAQLEEEARVRERMGQLRAENIGASEEELRAIVALEDDLRKLADIRRHNVIASDEELVRLEGLRRGRDEETAALRAQQAELQRLDQIRSANDNLRRQVETPEERIRREIGEIEGNRDFDSDLVARRVRQLRDEYRDLAEAQYEASVQGRILTGVLQGQIRSAEDLKRVLIAMVADAALREFFAMMGGGGGGGGIGGAFSRVAGRLGIGSIVRALPWGGGRDSGGPMYAGQRYGVAETKPEIALVGGWGHVAPNAAVEGLAVLSRLSKLAQAPAAAAQLAAPQITIVNQTGKPVDARTEMSIGQDGAYHLQIALTNKTAGDIADGSLDEAARNRWGVRAPIVRR